MSQARLVRCFAVILVATSLLCPAQVQNSTDPGASLTAGYIRSQHLGVLDALNGIGRGNKPLDLGDPDVPALVNRGWDLAGQWAAKFLDTHRTPSKIELQRIFQGFAPKPEGTKSKYGNFLEYEKYWFAGEAIRIAPAIYVVHGSYGMDFSTGTFIVAARQANGHFQALWNIKLLAEKHYLERDEIGRWVHLVGRAYYNGPLDVRKILPIRAAANGNPRFMVDAYQGADGGTILAQLSIWEWNGTEATPVLIKTYEYAADYFAFQFDGENLRIATKEDLQSFSSCGMCPEPRGIWKLRITPSGVQDLGHQFRTPEFNWADQLLSKVEKGENVSDIANPKVVSALQGYIHSESAADPSGDRGFNWGMLDKCRIISRGNEGAFVLDLDEVHLRLTYDMRGDKPYFTSITIR